MKKNLLKNLDLIKMYKKYKNAKDKIKGRNYF